MGVKIGNRELNGLFYPGNNLTILHDFLTII